MKHSPLNSYVSVIFSSDYEENLDEEGREKLSDMGDNDPEHLYIENERLEQMYRDLDLRLSAMERKVVGLYLNGLSRSEIADALGKSPKSIDNALNRVHNKLKE